MRLAAQNNIRVIVTALHKYFVGLKAARDFLALTTISRTLRIRLGHVTYLDEACAQMIAEINKILDDSIVSVDINLGSNLATQVFVTRTILQRYIEYINTRNGGRFVQNGRSDAELGSCG